MALDRYPKNWKKLALAVKEAANWQCQKCGLFCIKPGEPLSDAIKSRHRAYTLQVHHWNHNPADNRLENLVPLYTSCPKRVPSSQSRKYFPWAVIP